MNKVYLILVFLFFNVTIGYGQGNINKVEYFIDTDPGFGLANNITITPSTSIDVDFNIDLNGVANGFHILYLRHYR